MYTPGQSKSSRGRREWLKRCKRMPQGFCDSRSMSIVCGSLQANARHSRRTLLRYRLNSRLRLPKWSSPSNRSMCNKRRESGMRKQWQKYEASICMEIPNRKGGAQMCAKRLNEDSEERRTEWRLRLYVAGQTPRSVTALANL